ncbi:MAG: DUF1819 family protein [Clostridia bacterium]|nr:DUF1819 family protein [Clostridia bacterium]
MNINSDINILGGLSDFNLIGVLLNENIKSMNINQAYPANSSIKTIKSYKRFENAIKHTLLTFTNQNMEDLVQNVFAQEGLSHNCLLLLFWNASVNNELLDYLNRNVYFPALYSGRVSLKRDEVIACLKELRQTEVSLQKWSDSTINTTASKYLTLLKKFNLMEGGRKKTIAIPNMSDKGIVLFVYYLLSVETKSNLLESRWLQYCFLEKEVFIQQIMKKRYMKYFNLQYSADNLKIEPTFAYKELYNEL